MISVILSPKANALLDKYISTSSDFETGGFLYGRINPSWIYIGEISGPGPCAVQKKCDLKLDREYLVSYTEKMLNEEYFVVGTWHTHPPNSKCMPSFIDIKTMKSFVSHGLSYVPYVFCIANKSNEGNNLAFFIMDNTKKIQNIDIEVGD